MDRFTIANAVETLEELYDALVNAYWDSSDVFQKDTIFDILSTITSELNELGKLSIADHSMRYEPVTEGFPACARKFKQLQSNIDSWFPRTDTARNLNETLINATALIAPKYA
ncbi:MAG: hypothetical protein K6L76_02445 [Agarilytica sp.]